MKPQHLLLLLPLVEAYVPNNNGNGKPFIKRGKNKLDVSAMSSAPPLPSTTPIPTNGMHQEQEQKDTHEDVLKSMAEAAASKFDEILASPAADFVSMRDAEAQHGMPWKSSIDESLGNDELLYMPFWEWQMDFMENNLSNIKVEACENDDMDFSHNANKKKNARIVNLCFSSDEYRKIRLTYYDAGDNTQVFNSVFYPRPEYNLPVLGIDLLAFNRKKYLAIVDFQPIHDDEADHAVTYEHMLEPIKNSYESLQGKMSAKFYDETKFFSQQMLFARFEEEEVVGRDLFPAFQSYVETHLDLVKSLEPDYDNSAKVMQRQEAYDVYSAERDPAAGLFTAMFGAEWADGFMHDFLFSMSRPGAVNSSDNN
eukprot:CAMPEP_0198124382 /NCGR_PEP_ID=MMETSP1442-20131203/39772_1 /TAXON_ID= /ORGANISM="Craspedostauros australis, Strain CCMP3328" /LENGTH=367 /DNA_ID=CAMNT_0043783767 /DNA_START=79 /DNA_END=1182 /DNA_ORIENTATION=-